MANEFVIKNGFFSQGTSNVTGNLTVSQAITASIVSASTYIGISANPGATDQTVQFNSGSTFSGSTSLVYDYNNGILSGTKAQFSEITASFVNFLNVTGSYSGDGSYLTNITASALNDTTGTFAVQGIQDGQYLKRVGNLIVGTFFVGSVLVIPEDVNVLTCGISASDSITTAYVFNGSAV